MYFGNLPDYDDLEVDFRSALAREVELHRLGGIDKLKVIPKRFGIEGRTASKTISKRYGCSTGSGLPVVRYMSKFAAYFSESTTGC